MKGKTKTQKGITLIALIITIVVLLILAAVAINSITGDGILGKAQDAATKYNQAVEDEGDMLDYYELVLAGLAWTQNGTKVTRGDITLEVGTTVTGYDETKDKDGNSTGAKDVKWQVLGAENGKLLLMSETSVTSVELSDKDGYLNGVTTLNNACEQYGKGEYALEARSINMEDVNRITGYNPSIAKFKWNEPNDASTEDNTYLEVGYYGNEVTYKMNGSHVAFSPDPNGSDEWITADGTDPRAENKNYTSFVTLDGKILGTDIQTVTFKSTYYRYYLDTVNVDLKTDSDAFKMLDKSMWLATQSVYTRFGRVNFGIRYYDSNINYYSAHELWSTNGANDGPMKSAVYAVVVIDPNTQVSASGELSGLTA